MHTGLLSSRLYCRYRNCTDSAHRARGLSPPVGNFAPPRRLHIGFSTPYHPHKGLSRGRFCGMINYHLVQVLSVGDRFPVPVVLQRKTTGTEAIIRCFPSENRKLQTICGGRHDARPYKEYLRLRRRLRKALSLRGAKRGGNLLRESAFFCNVRWICRAFSNSILLSCWNNVPSTGRLPRRAAPSSQ